MSTNKTVTVRSSVQDCETILDTLYKTLGAEEVADTLLIVQTINNLKAYINELKEELLVEIEDDFDSKFVYSSKPKTQGSAYNAALRVVTMRNKLRLEQASNYVHECAYGFDTQVLKDEDGKPVTVVGIDMYEYFRSNLKEQKNQYTYGNYRLFRAGNNNRTAIKGQNEKVRDNAFKAARKAKYSN